MARQDPIPPVIHSVHFNIIKTRLLSKSRTLVLYHQLGVFILSPLKGSTLFFSGIWTEFHETMVTTLKLRLRLTLA